MTRKVGMTFVFQTGTPHFYKTKYENMILEPTSWVENSPRYRADGYLNSKYIIIFRLPSNFS